ncbi:MAG TPA: hypothetical protein VMA53_09745 [Stellaceae bacterium]|nr:hypothetical protein [Stellaceae bacterium]
MKTVRRFLPALIGGALMLASAAARAEDTAPCPDTLPAGTRCYSGQDENGAWYWIAIPQNWNNALVVHAHGGPRLEPVSAKISLEDLERFSVVVRQGYAWAGTSYRHPGWGVRLAAADVDNLRRLFIARFGKPKRIILHGQSWGGNVAAKAIELYAKGPGGGRNYDGVMLTSGVIAGATKAYLFRADLRAVYQYYCRNWPRPDEPQYPLWMGLPADSRLTRKDLAERVNDCTGVELPAEQRSATQKQNLKNILDVIRIPRRSLTADMAWATFLFRDMVQRTLASQNPFSNRKALYYGSSDDAALNRDVVRFDADPRAVAALAEDGDLTGKIAVPVITMHAIDDPTAMVEYEAVYHDTVAAAGRSALLVQTFTDEHEHSKLADAEYATLLDALGRWIDSGRRPSAAEVAARCPSFDREGEGGCHFEPGFQPGPLFSRVTPR